MAKKSAGGFDAQGQRVQNVGAPTDPADASSKSYVDGLIVKNNFAATSPPSAGNDSSQGYSIGSSWLMPGTGDMWRARSVSVGAARWVKIDVADHPGYVSGRYYVPFGLGPTFAGTALALGTMQVGFGTIKERITVSQLGARVATAAAGGLFQLAIYTHNPATGLPGTLVGFTASGSTATATLVNMALSANQTLEPGHYWFALQVDNATAVFLAVGGGGVVFASLIGSTVAAIGTSTSSQPAGFTTPATFGTWPANLNGAAFTELQTRGPLVQFLVASVP